jgi:hypothetical protein
LNTSEFSELPLPWREIAESFQVTILIKVTVVAAFRKLLRKRLSVSFVEFNDVGIT